MPGSNDARGRGCGKETRHGHPGHPIEYGGLGFPTVASEAPLVRPPSPAMEFPFQTLRMDSEPSVPCFHQCNMLLIFLVSLYIAQILFFYACTGVSF